MTSDDLTTLDASELELLLQGACFLGSGGGGPLDLGRQFIEQIEKAPHPVRLIDPVKVPAEWRGAISAGVGSPTAASSGFPSDAPAVAWEELAHANGSPFDVIVPAEVGAGNTFVPLLLSAQTGLPVIDGAGADRAVPSLPLCTFAAAGVPLGTVVLGNSEVVVRFEGGAPTAADPKMRTVLGAGLFDQDAGSAMWAMTGAQVASAAVPRTTTRALQVGKLLASSSDPVNEVAKLLGGKVLVQGTITDIGETTGGGFDTGHVTITAADGSTAVTVINVNENLIALSSDAPSPVATAPDLLCYVTSDGKAFSNAEAAQYQASKASVALVLVPSSDPMRSTAMRQAFVAQLASLGYYGPLVLLPR